MSRGLWVNSFEAPHMPDISDKWSVTDTTTTSVLSVLVNSDERAILEAAAEQSRTTLSDFMRRKALEAADLLGRTIITIPAKDWEQFEAWIGASAKAIPALEELGGAISSWEK